MARDTGEAQGIVLLGFSSKLILDGKEYGVVAGKVVPASSQSAVPSADNTVQTDNNNFVQLPDEDPAEALEDELVPIPDFVTTESRRDSTFPPSGFHTFTRTRPYWGFGDGNGSGAEQQKYSNNRTMWGYKLSPAVRSIVAGNIVRQLADRYHGNTRLHYGSHYGVPPDYQFHGSSGGIESRGTYATTFRAEFRHNIGPGGNAVLSAQWNWQRR